MKLLTVFVLLLSWSCFAEEAAQPLDAVISETGDPVHRALLPVTLRLSNPRLTIPASPALAREKRTGFSLGMAYFTSLYFRKGAAPQLAKDGGRPATGDKTPYCALQIYLDAEDYSLDANLTLSKVEFNGRQQDVKLGSVLQEADRSMVYTANFVLKWPVKSLECVKYDGKPWTLAEMRELLGPQGVTSSAEDILNYEKAQAESKPKSASSVEDAPEKTIVAPSDGTAISRPTKAPSTSKEVL